MKNWLIGLMMAATAVAAQAEEPRVRLFGSVAYGIGGDKVATAQYANGADIELLAGNGWTWTIGADLRLVGPFALQVNVGQQRNRVAGANFDWDFVRNPAEVIVFYSVSEQVRLGLGAHKTYNAKFTESGSSFATSADYDGSTGTVLEGQYFFTAPTNDRSFRAGMNLRFIRENFTRTQYSGGSTPTATDMRGDQIALGLFFYY